MSDRWRQRRPCSGHLFGGTWVDLGGPPPHSNHTCTSHAEGRSASIFQARIGFALLAGTDCPWSRCPRGWRLYDLVAAMTAEWPQWLLATINDSHEGAIKKRAEGSPSMRVGPSSLNGHLVASAVARHLRNDVDLE